MSYPKKTWLFKKWAEAMVAGATVDNPDYGKKTHVSKRGTTSSTRNKRRRRRRRKKKTDA